jgi:hypothetical protein
MFLVHVFGLYGAGTKTNTKTSGTGDPEIKLHNYSHLIIDKGANTYTGQKDDLFNK